MRPTILAGALAVLALAPAATSAATERYTSFWAFGDSLTDPGNLFALTGGAAPPSPPYFAGRFSNGPVWAEAVAGGFAGRGLAAGNFAHGGARAVLDDAVQGQPVDIPDLPDQVALFDAASDGRLGARPVAALWFGANDLFAALASGDPAVVAGAAAGAAAAVADGVGALAALGVADFVVLNQAPFDLVPRFALAGAPVAALAGGASDAFNAALAAELTGLGGGLDVAVIDVDAAVGALIADPGSLGLSDAVLPCLVPPSGGSPGSLCSPAELAGKVFFDPIHPTAAVHAAIADLARAEVAPVPLPPALAGMGAALALLALVRRRVGVPGRP